MRLSTQTPLLLLSALVAFILPAANAEDALRSSSLAACQASSLFTASLFDVVFTPNNNTVSINMIATSSIEGKVIFDITILAYGYQIIRTTVDPCNANLPGLCPMTSGDMSNPFNLPVGPDAVRQIPGIAYTFPDLDATVKVFVNMTSGDQAGHSVACVEANISNGKTVDLIGVKWGTAAIVGLALMASAIVSGLGYINAASHIAANTLSLFGYFQAQAMVGLCGVPLPPVVQSWTQDFAWSMGIIKVDFIQTILTWYQRSTGGTASTIFDSLHTVSVQVEKRAMPMIESKLGQLIQRSTAMLTQRSHIHAVSLAKRANIQTDFGSYIVYGIQRVAFRAMIETTNLFLTGLVFWYIFVLVTAILVLLSKGFCELGARTGFIKGEAFADFRKGWLTVLKGILFRLVLIGLPQMAILCLWEFTQNDSPAAMVLAVFFFFGMVITLGWAAFKVFRMARRSLALHKNPAYILFSDPQALNKWGFLYVQFRASAYYFIGPLLIYILIKSMFIAFAQSAGVVQAVAFIVLEAAALITASVIRPWMDKSTNSFNIAICVMNFLNAIFLLIFTDVFGLPPLVIGVVGVIFWIANAAFSLILLLMLIITTTIILFHNNPDTRYQFMNDDRTSFMKSQTQLHTNELDALAVTARSSGRGFKPVLDLEDDNESAASSAANVAMRRASISSARNSMRQVNADPSYPQYHDNAEPGQYLRNQSSSHFRSSLHGQRSGTPLNESSSNSSQGQHSIHGHHNSQHNISAAVGYRSPNGAAPWQRGAGYDD
ncbi:hypothetical protein B0H67DRAFT_556654 [Lasiosphaeris hirsuta]|uniref:ML-like domain-containing protein n=1 Tax=Lasiosphaeris hirsuta TaxID=260670 RepID=A0AA40A2P5_9PEZI|nr:hypothetical protein B0H67DRAFT_556654 [Lasiosphaeris hirsuta]